jgi:hypothetical protein
MRLIFTSGSREGQSVEIDGARLTVGRVEDNDVQLEDDLVSRRHAVIELEDSGQVVLRDLDSRNGTFVDGVRLSGPRVLTGGECLRFGSDELRVETIPTPPAASSTDLRDRLAQLGTRRAVLASAAVAVVVAVIGVAQIVLPGVAERSLRSDLSRYGPVRHVDIESLPAVKLLRRRADRVQVVMDSYRSEPGGHGSVADFLSDTRATGELDARVGILDAQLLTLHEVRLHKDGDALVGQARLTQRDLRDALPTVFGLRPLAATRNGIVLRASASILGRRAAVRLRVLADGGRLVVRPEGIPFGSLATITVFNDPRVYVESFGARLRGDRYRVTARGRLR